LPPQPGKLGLVPSALTYRVRQIEDALDVLLFDRSARQARPTEAGAELLREGGGCCRTSMPWPTACAAWPRAGSRSSRISVDGVISPHTMLELVEAFYAMSPPTRLKLRDGIMTGTLEALTSGRADLAIGVSPWGSNVAGLQQGPLGELRFIYVVAPHHPLASGARAHHRRHLLQHRAVAVADSAQRGGLTMGLLGGQDVLTVDTMQAKVQAQLRGLGGGFLPEPMVRPYLEAGRLVERAWPGPSAGAPALCLGRPRFHGTGARVAMVAEAAAKPGHAPGPAGKPPPFLMPRQPARV
jgi:DNA-binding transcriptional LysR family regulator